MDNIKIDQKGYTGRITLARPEALNALNLNMVRVIHQTLRKWKESPDISMIIIDAEGERAFCSGGDIAAVYNAADKGDHKTGQEFFFSEYRMNAEIANYPIPVIAFMQGFVMGGGVGIGGHASHRIIGNTTSVAMPESSIGLIPDVGGSWLLARAPEPLGEYLMMTADRMGPGDAIYAGFADLYIPEAEWPALISQLEATGNISLLQGQNPPDSPFSRINLSAFRETDIATIISNLTEQAEKNILKSIRRNSPLSMAAGLRLVRAARNDIRIEDSLTREYRFTSRATQMSDFIEGVRAQIIDKDRNPDWTAAATPDAVDKILASLGPDELYFD